MPPDVLNLGRLRTPLGVALIVTDESAILRAFNWTDYEASMRAWIARCYPATVLEDGEIPTGVRSAFGAYFGGDAAALGTIAWAACGTPFQLKVWETLCGIPAGSTISYRELAARVGRPLAMRAVGAANGANPVALVAPCHRVIGADGSLTGYGGGLARKRWLLEHEGASFAAP